MQLTKTHYLVHFREDAMKSSAKSTTIFKTAHVFWGLAIGAILILTLVLAPQLASTFDRQTENSAVNGITLHDSSSLAMPNYDVRLGADSCWVKRGRAPIPDTLIICLTACNTGDMVISRLFAEIDSGTIKIFDTIPRTFGVVKDTCEFNALMTKTCHSRNENARFKFIGPSLVPGNGSRVMHVTFTVKATVKVKSDTVFYAERPLIAKVSSSNPQQQIVSRAPGAVGAE